MVLLAAHKEDILFEDQRDPKEEQTIMTLDIRHTNAILT